MLDTPWLELNLVLERTHCDVRTARFYSPQIQGFAPSSNSPISTFRLETAGTSRVGSDGHCTPASAQDTAGLDILVVF